MDFAPLHGIVSSPLSGPISTQLCGLARTMEMTSIDARTLETSRTATKISPLTAMTRIHRQLFIGKDKHEDLALYRGDEINYHDLAPYCGDEDITRDTSLDYQDCGYLPTDASSGSWAKRKDGNGYDAHVSDQSSECDGRFQLSKKARMDL